jgi:hypothetical protein
MIFERANTATLLNETMLDGDAAPYSVSLRNVTVIFMSHETVVVYSRLGATGAYNDIVTFPRAVDHIRWGAP